MTKDKIIINPSSEDIKEAAAWISSGRLVAFPTETVYGLGGDATNEKAIAAIYEAKGRPRFNPLIAHVASTQNIETYVKWNYTAQKLADRFWPGPLTMVLPRAKNSPISLLASAGLDTVAIRCPNHKIAQELIREARCPIAAPSANASGKLSPTEAIHVAESLGDTIGKILDGGPCRVGLESTVIDLTTPHPTLLRPGGVTKTALESILGPIREALHDENAPKSPGMLLSHYAPELPVRLNASTATPTEGYLTFGPDSHIKGGKIRLNLSPDANMMEAAAHLFTMLRELDRPDLTGIAVMPIPHDGLGAAINDRLQRAAMDRN